MNYQIRTKRKFWAVVVGAFVLGLILSPNGGEAQVASEADTKPTIQTVEVVKEVKVKDTEGLHKLDAIDQEIFALSAEVVDAQGKALEAAGGLFGQYPFIPEHEIEAATAVINEQTQVIQNATSRVEAKRAERADLLTN